MTETQLELFGKRLMDRREETGLTLHDIASKTKIPLNVLEAVEAGATNGLPAPVFVKGFLRSYSLEIGLDPEEIIEEYKFHSPEAGPEVKSPITSRKPLDRPSGLKNIFTALLVILLVGGGVFLGVTYWPISDDGPITDIERLTDSGGGESESSASDALDSEELVALATDSADAGPSDLAVESDPDPVDEESAALDTLDAPTESGGEPDALPADDAAIEESTPADSLDASADEAASPPSAAAASDAPGDESTDDVDESGDPDAVDVVDDGPDVEPMDEPSNGANVVLAQPTQSGLELELIFEGASWVQVGVDGGETQHGLFPAGESKTWEAESGFLIRVGNGGGVRAILNGKDLGLLGEPGRAVNLNLPSPAGT